MRGQVELVPPSLGRPALGFTSSVARAYSTAFLLIPLWWVLGLDQFVTLVAAGVLYLRYLLDRNLSPLYKPPVVIPISVFLLILLISGVFIVENVRFITYVRNIIVTTTGFLLFLFTIYAIRSKSDLYGILRILNGFTTLCVITGFLAIIGLLDISFTAPIYNLVPDGLRSSDMIARWYGKVFVINTSLFEDLNFPRVLSYFTHETMYAAALVILIPLQIFYHFHLRKKKWLMSLSILILAIINFFFAAARGAFLGLIGASLILLILRMKPFKRLLLGFSITVIMLLLFLFFSSEVGTINQLADMFFTLRGEGSVATRSEIYGGTINSWLERPVFGWGTQRSRGEALGSGESFPYGSHSTYLGILYSQGAFGLMLYLIILFFIFREIVVARKLLLKHPDYKLSVLLNFITIAIIGNSINAITESMDLDVLTFHIIWITWGVLFSLKKLIVNPKTSD